MMKYQLFRFLIIGSGAALTHFICLFLLVEYLEYQPAWANLLAFCCAFLVSFLGHFHITFSQINKQTWSDAIVRWFIISITAFIMNQFLFVLAIHYIGENRYIIIWLSITIIITLFTFILGKFWAFLGKKN